MMGSQLRCPCMRLRVVYYLCIHLCAEGLHFSAVHFYACTRVTVVVLSVCPSVTALAASASVHTWNQRYSIRRILTSGFSKKPPFNSYGVTRGNREPFSHTLGTNGGQQLPEAQLAGRMLLHRLATGAHNQRDRPLPTCYILRGIVRACAVYVNHAPPLCN